MRFITMVGIMMWSGTGLALTTIEGQTHAQVLASLGSGTLKLQLTLGDNLTPPQFTDITHQVVDNKLIITLPEPERLKSVLKPFGMDRSAFPESCTYQLVTNSSRIEYFLASDIEVFQDGQSRAQLQLLDANGKSMLMFFASAPLVASGTVVCETLERQFALNLVQGWNRLTLENTTQMDKQVVKLSSVPSNTQGIWNLR